jgi:hypothetical protein
MSSSTQSSLSQVNLVDGSTSGATVASLTNVVQSVSVFGIFFCSYMQATRRTVATACYKAFTFNNVPGVCMVII